MNNLDIYNPQWSVSLSSSAGSGKTHALTTRLISLLLSGVKPAEILAITFTNLAANEIREKLFQRIAFLEEGKPDEVRLFCSILKIEAGELRIRACEIKRELIRQFSLLQISTIHSFFAKIIHCFPEETNVLDITVIDEGRRRALIQESVEQFYHLLHRDSALLERVYNFIISFRERKLLTEATIRDIHGSVHSRYFLLENLLGAMSASIDDQEKIFTGARKSLLSTDFTHRIRSLTRMLSEYLEQSENRWVESFNNHLRSFLEEGNIRSLAKTPAFSRYSERGMIGYLNKLQESLPTQEADRFRDLFTGIWSALQNYFMTEMNYYVAVWLEIYTRIQGFYQEKKGSARLIDFTDIEILAYRFLREINDFHFFHFRLGTKIRHILIDEFQDTSELQWNALRRIAQNCLLKKGTVFYVGDIKQSIYRWRGGEPKLFEKGRTELGLPKRRLGFSYRQSPVLLRFVNDVFTAIGPRMGLYYTYEPQMLPPEKRDDNRGYVHIRKNNDREACHRDIVRFIGELKGQGVSIPDIAVLCRKNSEIEEIEWVLRDSGIPFISTGRSRLLNDYCIIDVVNILRFILDPDEEMYLTSLLRTPVFRLDYENLVRCKDENGMISLSGIRKADSALYDRLAEILSCSYYETPSGFLRKLYEGLNIFEVYPHHREALLQFYELAYSFEAGSHQITLGDFANYLEENRDLLPLKVSEERGVTVQTIHSSKGLEYHTVIVPFLSQSFHYSLDGSLIFSRDDTGRIKGYSIAGRVYMDYHPDRDAVSEIRDETDLNYRIDEINTLYVAMTRARENLIVLPLSVKNRETVGDVVMKACDPGYSQKLFPFEVKRGKPVKSTHDVEIGARVFTAVRRKGEQTVPAVQVEDSDPVYPDLQQRRVGLLRGLVFHSILQRITKLPVDEETLERYLWIAVADEGKDYTKSERAKALENLRRSVLSVVADDRVAKYFSGKAVSELGIFSSEYRNLLGRVDRIYIDDCVEVIDFKTTTIEKTEDLRGLVHHYRPQVQSYCRVISRIFPEKPVLGWLYFTEADFNERLVLAHGR